MIFGLLVPLFFLVILIIVVRKLLVRDGHGAPSTFSIRRLFQYALLFGLLSVSALGVAGLIGRLFDAGQVIVASRTDLARDITFVLVGVPLYLLVGRWTKRTLAEDSSERHSVAWNAYLSIVSITALITAMTSGYGILLWVLGNETFQGQELSRLLVWVVIWSVHWRLIQSTSREEESRTHYIVGSLIGLGVLSTGVANLVTSVAQLALDNDEKALLLQRTDPSIKALILIVIGLPVWYQYWLRVGENLKRELLWFSYVLLIGVAGGFIALIGSASVMFYDSLVWFFGDSTSNLASQHFSNSIGALGSAVVGFGVWSYHAKVLRSAEKLQVVLAVIHEKRGEIRRVYEYIISGISLIAASAGLMMVLVAILESLTPGEVVSTTSSTNTLLAAITLILIGSPVWWFFWQRIESHVVVDGFEQSSPTRRIFLLMLFGVASVAAVVSVLTGVFLFLDDLLNGQLSFETLRQARFAIAILLSNAAIAWYHWSIYRNERSINVRKAKLEKFVILVGPKDPELAREIEREINGKVQMWDSQVGGSMDVGIPWEKEKVIELIQSSTGDEIMIINEKKKLRAIPFQRN